MTATDHRIARRLVYAGLAAAALWLAASPADGQTLADVARQEQSRRRTIKNPAKLYTNADLIPAPPGGPAPPPGAPAETAPAEAAQPAAAAPAAPATETPTGATGGPARDEAYWRKRITDVRVQIDQNVILVESVQSRINALWADFTARDDPAQRAVIFENRQKALAELDRLKQEGAALQKQAADIEEEARRANVPPGWLR